MKEQINRYARGVFDYDPLVLKLETNSIYGVADIEKGYNGQFSFSERDGRDIKGIIYTDNDRVILRQRDFSSKNIDIDYFVDCSGLAEGDIIDGKFYIVSNGGEDSVSYSFRAERTPYESECGRIRNLNGFAELAQKNEAAAVRMFQDKDFETIIIQDDISLRSMYQCLKKGNDPRLEMEEFLIAAGKKKPVGIMLTGSAAVFEGVRETFRDSVTVEKDGWGFVDVSVSVKSDFITIEKSEITSDMFAGNRYEFAYIVNYDRMHDGVNFGEITFAAAGRKITYTVRAVKNRASAAKPDMHEFKALNCELMKLYIDFRTHRLPMNEWIRETGKTIGKIRKIDDSQPFYRLMLAHTYIAAGNDAKAKELMDNVKDEVSDRTREGYPLYCYFLYVNSLYMRDRAYSRKAAAAVNKCYEEYKDWRILWILLFLDEELEINKSIKLLRIKEQFNMGCNSPAMYLEACNILNEQPQLLRVLDSFEINVLTFGARNEILDGELTFAAAEMTLNVRNAGAAHIRLLEAIYDTDDDVVVLESLCKMLIRNGRVGTQYLRYYGDGIENELKITQLFEYYLMSRNKDDMSVLPKMLLMYFGYNNNLDYNNKAYLYANVIYNKDANPQIYESYVPQIKVFVREEILKGHINGNLAYVYRNFVVPEIVTEENADAVSELYFTYKVTCSIPGMRSIIVRHKESRGEREYPLNGAETYVKIYTSDPAVAVTDASGNRYFSGKMCTIERMLEDDKILEKCAGQNNELVHIRLSRCEKYMRYQKKTLEAVNCLTEMSKMPEMNSLCRDRLIDAVIRYYYDGYDVEGFEKFIKNVDVDMLPDSDICMVAEIYIVEGEYARAYELIKKHSAMQIQHKRLLKLCSGLNEAAADTDEELVFLNYICFVNGKYDENMIDFLAAHFNGTVRQMTAVWKKAVGQGTDTYDIEERIISQSLFTHTREKETDDIFDSYFAKGPNHRIVEAYLSCNSYEYFVRQKDISEKIFDIMETVFENDAFLPAVCSMALLKYYSQMDELNGFRTELAQKSVMELSRKSYIFPFFEKLGDRIKLPFNVIDKKLVEYRTDPSHRVIIHYTYEGRNHTKSYVAEDMKNVYEGIFVKSFVLFYGERLTYYISEENGEEEITTESRTVDNNTLNPKESGSRFDRLNDIIASRDSHDEETLEKLVHTYAVNECVVNQIFKPI